VRQLIRGLANSQHFLIGWNGFELKCPFGLAVEESLVGKKYCYYFTS
jgi:hypothetical protein